MRFDLTIRSRLFSVDLVYVTSEPGVRAAVLTNSATDGRLADRPLARETNEISQTDKLIWTFIADSSQIVAIPSGGSNVRAS